MKPAWFFGVFLMSAVVPAVSFSQACGSADPAYIRTAVETGGIPMFLQRSEAAKSFQLVRESTRSNVSTVLWAAGSLDSHSQEFRVPVDSMTQRITFTVSFAADGGTATIVSPSRAPVEQSANTEIADLHCGRIATLVSPEKGEWSIELSGRGRFWLEAQAQSDIYIVAAEFVREGGRPGHEGFFRIDGQPVAGKPATLQVSLSTSAARAVEFHLAGEDGKMIQQLQMEAIDSSGEFMGTTGLPGVPFRFAVSGTDANGWPYQRYFPSLFHAENVEVTWVREFDEIAAGTARQARFTVRNIGVSRTLKITATDARRFVTGIGPKDLTLAPGQSGVVVVNLAVPAGAADTSDDVIVLATTVAGPAASNSSVAHFSITPGGVNPGH